MKFFVAFAALAAVALAGPVKPVTSFESELEAIIAAIHSPTTDPATAIALEQQLQDILGGVGVGPAIVENPVPVSIEPALIDFPVPDSAVLPNPITIGPANNPLVQIIVNVNSAQPVDSPFPVSPVIVEDQAENHEVDPTPVQVVDVAPVEVEPVIIGTPSLVPTPVINIPEILN